MEGTIIIQPYKLFSIGFLKGYLITMRPYLLFVSGITGIVGMSLGPDIISIKIILVFLASFLSYGFGQALTDCFQMDTAGWWCSGSKGELKRAPDSSTA